MPSCHCLEILHNFWRRSPVFSFCTGPCKVSLEWLIGCLFFSFRFYISMEWIQSFCCCCRTFINFYTWFKIWEGILISVYRAHIFPSASGPQVAQHSTVLETFVIVTTKECYWHLVDGGQDATKHPTRHRTAPTARNYLSGPKCQYCWGQETLLYRDKSGGC